MQLMEHSTNDSASAFGRIRSGRKLRLDFPCAPRLRVAMDRDRSELVVSLCTQAGMIMEDASPLAITLRGQDEDRVGEVLTRLEAEVSAMATLIAAARTLHGRG